MIGSTSLVRVLLVEDNLEVSTSVCNFLGAQGFEVQAVAEGLRGVDMGMSGFDAVILDVNLPDTDGFEVLKRLRAKSSVPVILLTELGGDEDRIAGLDLGADDYLPKPFNPRELVARLKAVLRRQDSKAPGGRLSVNGVLLDPGTREVSCDANPVRVTTVEFVVLDMLMRSAGRPVSRDDLMLALYGRKATPYDRSIDMHVSHLRKKLKSSRELIKTVRGAGYQFCLQAQ